MLHVFVVKAEEEADIGSTVEDEDEGSNDPNLKVRNPMNIFFCSL